MLPLHVITVSPVVNQFPFSSLATALKELKSQRFSFGFHWVWRRIVYGRFVEGWLGWGLVDSGLKEVGIT